jgi:hypothetical protein
VDRGGDGGGAAGGGRRPVHRIETLGESSGGDGTRRPAAAPKGIPTSFRISGSR